METRDKNIKYKLEFLHINVIYLVAILVIFFSSPAEAQNQDAINQQDWITRNQQNILEEKKRSSEFETIKKERERKKKEEEEDSQKLQQLNVSGKSSLCFPIAEIRFNNANSLSSFRKKKLASPFIGKCFEAKILADVVAAVNAYYQSKGYVTTQVLVPQQNLQSGIFELKIIEGKVEKISLGKDRFVEKMQELTAFGNTEGDVLNIGDINQGMYQINRLQSNQAVMKIEPGNSSGESKIVIDNNKKFPARATIGKDNLGNQFTGVQRTNFSAGLDNLLFLNDSINLSYTTNLHDDSQVKDIKSFSSGISIPFKYSTFSYDYSRSEFRGIVPVQNAPVKYTGFSDQRKFTIDHVFLNKTNFRFSTNASLTAKESASYENDVKQPTSERKLSVMNVGFAVSSYLNDTTNIYLKPSYSRGLKILNSKKDQKNIPADNAKAQFEVFKLYASASKKFTIPKVNAAVTLTTEMDSQLAKETLFGSEQFSVGGYYSVRGFRENYINGDSGYYFRNKANFNIGSIILPLFVKENPIYFANLNKFKLEPFYDYGHARNKFNGSEGRMSGAGAKAIFESKYFNASVTYSTALQKSKLITSTIKENKMVYFELSASCC